MDPVIFTERAAKKMKEQLCARGTPDSLIRFGVRGGGCTGFSYVFEFEDKPRDTDHLFEEFGVRLVVDAKSMFLVQGASIDFETGIRGHGFRFENPNVKSECGCGASISF